MDEEARYSIRVILFNEKNGQEIKHIITENEFPEKALSILETILTYKQKDEF